MSSTPVHIPAHHGKVVDVMSSSVLVENNPLFESAREGLAEQGLSIEDGIAKAQSDSTFTIMIQNCNPVPVDLTTDQILGNIVPNVMIVERTGDTTRNL